MDLVNAAVNLQAASTMGMVQMAVAKKTLDMQRSTGDAMVALVEAASNGVAQAGDQMVAAATGLGGQVDVYG